MLYKELFSESEIHESVRALGARISKDYENKPLMMIAIADGGLMFAMDLIRNIDNDLEYGTCICKSYSKDNLRQDLKIHYFPSAAKVNNRHLVIIDDIKDSGQTLKLLEEYIYKNYTPNSIEVCVLIENLANKKGESPKYVALQSHGEWVAGYGLDDGDLKRNLRNIVCRNI